MEIDKEYTYEEITTNGLEPNEVENIDYLVYEKGEKVFFFEELRKDKLRLYSVINRNSFFLS